LALDELRRRDVDDRLEHVGPAVDKAAVDDVVTSVAALSVISSNSVISPTSVLASASGSASASSVSTIRNAFSRSKTTTE